MARPLTKFGELKKTMKESKLGSADVDSVLQKAIDEMKSRVPTTPAQVE